MSRRYVTDLRSLFAAELVEALTTLVDERVEHALADRTQDSGSPWLTLAEAAKYAHVSSRTLSRQVARGRIRTTTLGRRRLVHRDDLDVFLRGDGREGKR